MQGPRIVSAGHIGNGFKIGTTASVQHGNLQPSFAKGSSYTLHNSMELVFTLCPSSKTPVRLSDPSAVCSPVSVCARLPSRPVDLRHSWGRKRTRWVVRRPIMECAGSNGGKASLLGVGVEHVTLRNLGRRAGIPNLRSLLPLCELSCVHRLR